MFTSMGNVNGKVADFCRKTSHHCRQRVFFCGGGGRGEHEDSLQETDGRICASLLPSAADCWPQSKMSPSRSSTPTCGDRAAQIGHSEQESTTVRQSCAGFVPPFRANFVAQLNLWPPLALSESKTNPPARVYGALCVCAFDGRMSAITPLSYAFVLIRAAAKDGTDKEKIKFHLNTSS